MPTTKQAGFPGNLIGPNSVKLAPIKMVKLRMHKPTKKECELFGLDYKKIRRK